MLKQTLEISKIQAERFMRIEHVVRPASRPR